MSDAEELDLYIARKKRQNLIVGLLVALGVVIATVWWVAGDLVSRWWQYEAPRLFAESSEVDYEKLHADLLPGWMLRLRGGLGEGRQDLMAEVEGDPGLAALAEEMVDLAQDDPWDHGERLLDICRDWTAHLDEKGEPWLMECNVVDMGSGAFFYTKSYKVIADSLVEVGDRRHRVRLLKRVDKTNVKETYLGHAGTLEGGARVVTDRIVESAVDDVWPRFGAKGPFGRALTEAAGGVISDKSVRVLEDTGRARQKMIEATESINRRKACSGFGLSRLPERGFGAATLARLETLTGSGNCPAVTEQEARDLKESTERLEGAEGLDEALGELTAWLAKGVMVHEARHLGDQAEVGDGQLPCPGCQSDEPDGVLREASAYLASFARPEVAAIALIQACEATAGGEGSHARAMALIERSGLEDLCASGPPKDLNAKATAMEEALFGRSETISVPEVAPF